MSGVFGLEWKRRNRFRFLFYTMRGLVALVEQNVNILEKNLNSRDDKKRGFTGSQINLFSTISSRVE